MERYRRRAAECTAAARRSASPEEQSLWLKLSDDWLLLAGEVQGRVEYWTDRARETRQIEARRFAAIQVKSEVPLPVIAFEPRIRPERVPIFVPKPVTQPVVESASEPERAVQLPSRAPTPEPKVVHVALPYLPATPPSPPAALPFLPATIAPAKRGVRAWPDPNVRIIRSRPSAGG